MKRIALFGGAFDPPHVGHAICITNILNSDLVDEVWLVPTGDSRYDKTASISATHRKELLKLFKRDYFDTQEQVKISLIQIDTPAEECATIDLLDQLSKTHSNHEFSVVIGSDNLNKLPSWRSSERLLKTAKFIVVQRIGYSIEIPDGINAECLTGESTVHSDVSSSLIRMLITQNRQVAGLVSKGVINYININCLYR